jgi:hypothetical protein
MTISRARMILKTNGAMGALVVTVALAVLAVIAVIVMYIGDMIVSVAP